MSPVIIIFLILGFGVLAYLGYQAEQRRREALFTWAVARGWHLDRGTTAGLHEDYPGVKLFERGCSRKARLMIRGEHAGHPIRCLDYKYTTGSGKNRSDHHYSVVILECDFRTMPMVIRPETPFDKMGEFLGHDDIDFESAEFSRRFFVKSSDRKWAYDVIHTRTMEYLLAAPRVTLEFGMNEIAVYVSGRANVSKYKKMLPVAMEMHRLIPDFVVRQMKGEGR